MEMTAERNREPTPESLQYGRRPLPVCPDHHVMMVVRRTTAEFRYCYCPCPECWRSKRQDR